jgi:Phage integrase family
VTVRRQLVEVNGSLSFGPPKTAAGRRTVVLPSFAMRSLVVHMDMYSESGVDGLVFPALEGGPLRRSNFRRRVWLPATQSAGVPTLRFHDLRHTGATLAAASGASLRALMSRIGHSSAAAAIRYQHVLDGQDADIARFLDGLATGHEQPSETADDPQPPERWGTRGARHLRLVKDQEPLATSGQEQLGGDDGTRTHDPLLAKQVL